GPVRVEIADQSVLIVGGAGLVGQPALVEDLDLVLGARQGPGRAQPDDASADDEHAHRASSLLGTLTPWFPGLEPGHELSAVRLAGIDGSVGLCLIASQFVD